MIRTLKKLYNGKADIRSYEKTEVLRKRESLTFILLGKDGKEKERMTIPPDQVSKKGFVTAKGIKSKIIPNQTFDLISYVWIPDGFNKLEEPQLELFE